jgi:RimJ/RimL family protein N-acetyltransferase
MELRDITTDDLPLYEGFYGDPSMMKHLGGAWQKERIPQKLRQNLEVVEAGTAWVFKVMPDHDSSQAAGLVCIWEHVWRGEPVNEIGWMILPAFQGRGLASRAVRAILEKARAEGRWDIVHALPAKANEPSNGVCRKAGFTLVEECDLEWNSQAMRCNHWLLDLRSTP